MKRYKVTCLDCNQSDVITVEASNPLKQVVVDYEGKFKSPFRAFRWRSDMKWGFECQCGNNNQLAPSEAEDMDKLVQGDPLSIKKIAASLLIPDDKQFIMTEMRAM